MKTVLELSTAKALDYFLQSSNYSTIAFPIYFDFKKILEFVKAKIGSKDFSACLKDKKKFPSDYDNVSYHLLMNKDGRYAYRPLQLVNPYLYYFLVREITKTSNWKFLIKRFKEFENPNCEKITPNRLPTTNRKPISTARIVTNTFTINSFGFVAALTACPANQAARCAPLFCSIKLLSCTDSPIPSRNEACPFIKFHPPHCHHYSSGFWYHIYSEKFHF